MRRILGIAGPPGGGKSTFAQAYAREHGGVVVPMDGFHLADLTLARLGRLDRKGAPDTFDVRGFRALLARLREEVDQPVYAPGFERTLEQPIAGAIEVPAGCPLVVTEGNYLLLDDPEWRAVADLIDEIWWIEVDDEIRRRRLVARHVEFGKTPEQAAAWVHAVDEANARLVAPGRARADRVISRCADCSTR